MSWRVPRIWEGGDVWIIGGGPSVPHQFDIPEKIIKQVISGALPPSAFSPYMHLIHTKHIIGVNMAYRIGSWIDMVVFGDSGFFLREQSGLANFPGLKVSFHSGSRSERWVKYLQRDTTHVKGISSNPTMVSWNGNTGAAAINVAVHAGAKRILLLGFDMNVDGQTRMQHWHDLYQKGPIKDNDNRRQRKLPFTRHLSGFPVIAEDAKRLGVTIINVSTTSEIMCFPKMTMKELFTNSES